MNIVREISVRRVTEGDFDQLYKLMRAAGRELLLSKCELRRNFSSKYDLDEGLISSTDGEFELDKSLVTPNSPSCQALLARVGGVPVGHVVFHYYYSPWRGRNAFVDDIFVLETHRKSGIAKRLMGRLSELCRNEHMPAIFFSTIGLDAELMATLENYGLELVRNEQTDWSVFRVDF